MQFLKGVSCTADHVTAAGVSNKATAINLLRISTLRAEMNAVTAFTRPSVAYIEF